MLRKLPVLGLLIFVVTSCSDLSYESDQRIPKISRDSLGSSRTVAPSNYPLSPSADLDDLVAAALSRHPSLTAIRARVQALQAASEKARYLPDPMASAGAGSLAETAAGQVQGTLSVQQKIPFPGKRAAQASVLANEALAAQSQLQTEELALAARVRNAWWSYYLSERKSTILRDSRDLLETLRDPVTSRIATGGSAPQDLLKLDNEITSLGQRIDVARGQGNAAAASLNALLLRPSGASLPTPRVRGFRSFGPADSLVARAFERHPEVRRNKALIASAQSQVALASLVNKPDFTAGLGWSPVDDDGIARSATGKDQFMATFGVTIPLWGGKNSATRKQADAQLAAAEATLSSTRALLQQQIGSAHASFIAEREALTPYEQVLLPNSEDSFTLTLSSYQTGGDGYLNLIDSWRQFLSYRLAAAENEARLGEAEAALMKAAAIR